MSGENGSYAVGIDLGTSSVKLFASPRGAANPKLPVRELREPYCGRGVAETVAAALYKLYADVRPGEIGSVGLSGQTGTFYAVRGGKIVDSVAWHQPGREEALDRSFKLLPQELFLRATGMRQPRLASYPAPTLLWFAARGVSDCLILQPKDYLAYLLTGEALTDCGSWRGLMNPVSLDYDSELLSLLGVGRGQLPSAAEYSFVSASGSAKFGLPEGTRVAVGYNDFYAALRGAGIEKSGDCFDVTGTSEHFGVVTPSLAESKLVASPYFGAFVHYGVTQSSGVSLDWARNTFGEIPDKPVRGAPVFLPYLRGERAPVFDSSARGMFAGLSESSDGAALAYSVAEGVAFSIYEIYLALGSPPISAIRATGGAAKLGLLGRLKASLIGAPVVVSEPDCGSALGAALAAGGVWETSETIYDPDAPTREFLLGRYALYAKLYPAWREITSGADTIKLFGKGDKIG